MVRCILRTRGGGGGGFYKIGIYKVAADEIRTAFRSGTRRRRRRLPCEFRPSSPRNERRTWKNGSPRCIDTTHQPNIILLLSPSETIRSNRRRRSHVPSIVPSASENGSDAEEPRQRQQQFLRQPSQRLETSFETVPGQQRQLSAADHQVGQGEPEQALEEPGESVHGRTRPPSDRRRQGTRPERGQRDAGERRERKTRGGGLLQPDGGSGRQIATLAHGGRPLTILDDLALGLTIGGAGSMWGRGITVYRKYI